MAVVTLMWWSNDRMCYLESTNKIGPGSGKWWPKYTPWETGCLERANCSETTGSMSPHRCEDTSFCCRSIYLVYLGSVDVDVLGMVIGFSGGTVSIRLAMLCASTSHHPALSLLMLAGLMIREQNLPGLGPGRHADFTKPRREHGR